MIESLLLSITFFLLIIISSPSVESKIDPKFEACSGRKTCRDNQTIKYPFYIDNLQEPFCGSPGFKLTCDNNNSGYPLLKLSGNYYRVHNISYENQTLRVSNAAVSTSDCIPFLQNTSLPDDRTFYLPDPNQRQLYLFYNCHINISGSGYYNGCDGYNRSVAGLVGEAGPYLSAVKRECNESESLMVVAPIDGDIEGEDKNDNSIGQVLRNGFVMKWKAGACQICNDSGGVCGFDNVAYRFMCYCRDRPHFNHCSSGKNHLPLQLSLGIGIPALILLCLFVILWCVKKRLGSLSFLSRNISSQPHSKSDLEGGCVYFGVPVFSYSELDEATHNFNSAKEVGDGGFGTVYHGKLKDGREVAVKRLYEHNYKRVEQFMNEVEILTRLRHTNLVSLYGCTSLKSQELLLVYEFIPNGTLADHLHGDLANPSSSLTWPLRMQIAIETASALAYLHASDIIHRDVKTNNILLDHNFSVKVADFGLSRLFPNDATHVSTAPQGTPGYVDPEYHQCYQLTCKSDVYSFGVVLMELISSMPAVDISRDKHEINLSNLAISKIRKRAFDEFVDKSLGFESDSEVRRMTIAVAELGLQCLHLEIESRPPMDEVLKDLKGIQRGEVEPENEGVNDLRRTHSPECDEVGSLKNTKMPSSPISVTDKWPSISTPSSRSVEVP